MGHDVNKRGFDPDDYQVAARMGGIRKPISEAIDPVTKRSFIVMFSKFLNSDEIVRYLNRDNRHMWE